MALAELGEIMSRARRQMLNATIIDEKVFNEFLDEISRALLQSDVPLELVSEIQTTMKETFNLIGDRNKKFQIFQLEIYDELCRILYPGNPSFTPKKGKASVIMFVGQGSEKTICKKYAYYHLKKGWKPALVCANTSRAGAFDQLEQNAINAKIPVYESHTESDLARVAVEGVERFKNENCDLIIIDTSGCHKQDASLFEEMRQVAEATKPDLVIFVMDSSIGQAAAFDQARAFKQSVSVGAVILTKMDGHAKGVGALSAVAATKSPVIFIGTGVLIDEFRVFDIRRFVSRILGMGDRFRSMDKIHEVVPMDQQPDLQQNLFERNFTLRIMCERFQKKLERGSIGKVIKAAVKRSRIELKPKDLEKEMEAKIKSYVTLMDFMTDEELDNPNPMLMTKTQILRIARTSGQPVEDVIDMLKMYKLLDKIRRKKMKGFKIPYKRLDKTWRKKMKGFKIPKKAEMSADEKVNEFKGGFTGLECLIKQMGSMGSAKEI